MYKYVISFIFLLLVQWTFTQNCPSNLNNSPGNSAFTISANVYNASGALVTTITCERTANSGFIDCDLESYNFPNDFYIVVNLGTPPNDIDCYYDADGNSIAPLKVELIDFDVLAKDKFNLIHWSTETESNNSHFTLEYSKDGFSYDLVKVVQGAGNSSVEQSYEVQHRPKNAGNSIIYYKLSQTDLNGTTEELGTKAITNAFPESMIMLVKHDQVVISDLTGDEISEVRLIDMTGRTVNTVVNPIVNTFNFLLSDKGLYFAQIIYRDGHTESIKFLF